MKSIFKTVLLLVFGLALINVNAQTLEESLSTAYKKLDGAAQVSVMMEAGSQFELAARKWSTAWIANYYAAYSKAIISHQETDAKKKDQLLDGADQYFAKVNALKGSSDETFVLAALLAQARLSVDPRNRWRKYNDLVAENLEKAKKANPDNPRIYYLEGIPVFNKPKLYGGGKDKAKSFFERAKARFAKQDATSVAKPHWGEKENRAYLQKCNE